MGWCRWNLLFRILCTISSRWADGEVESPNADFHTIEAKSMAGMLQKHEQQLARPRKAFRSMTDVWICGTSKAIFWNHNHTYAYLPYPPYIPLYTEQAARPLPPHIIYHICMYHPQTPFWHTYTYAFPHTSPRQFRTLKRSPEDSLLERAARHPTGVTTQGHIFVNLCESTKAGGNATPLKRLRMESTHHEDIHRNLRRVCYNIQI